MRYYIAFNPDSLAYDLRDSKINKTISSSSDLDVVKGKLESLAKASESAMAQDPKVQKVSHLFDQAKARIQMLPSISYPGELTDYTIKSLVAIVDEIEKQFYNCLENK